MQKVIQNGHSLAITIPRKFAQMVGIHKGDNVKIEKRPDRGQIILHFEGAQQLMINSVVGKSRKARPSRRTDQKK